MKWNRKYLFLVLAILIVALFIIFSALKDVAIDLEYAKMMANSEEYVGKIFNIKGQTFEVSNEGDNNYTMYVFTRKKEFEYDDDVLHLSGYMGENVKNGEVISCKAELTGLTEFTRASGEQIKVPQLQYVK